MSHVRKLAGYIRPYWREALLSLGLLTTVVLYMSQFKGQAI